MIRPGRRSDVPEMMALRTSVAENHMSVDDLARLGITPETVVADIESGERSCFVAEEGERIVGFSMSDRRDGQVFALFTRPGFEGRGHGSRLLAEALGWLIARGHREAWLTTAPGTRAERFYLRRGWRPAGATPAGDVILRLPLTPALPPAPTSAP
jgi:GNAT superfamily N-acetyltransferase